MKFIDVCENTTLIENTKTFIRLVIMDITEGSNVYKLLVNNKDEIISYWYMIKKYYIDNKIDKMKNPEEKCNENDLN